MKKLIFILVACFSLSYANAKPEVATIELVEDKCHHHAVYIASQAALLYGSDYYQVYFYTYNQCVSY